MNVTRVTISSLIVSAFLISLGGCAGMDRRQTNTAEGAGIGAVGGAILTNGSPIGAIGGAVIGGAIGHGEDRK